VITQLIIPAAGLGQRLGMKTPKALVKVCGRSLITRTLDRLLAVDFADPLIVIVPAGYENAFRAALSDIPSAIQYIEGGAERRDSVARGLEALNPDTELVVIHDAARPFPAARSVCAAIEAASRHGAATLATPCADTILIEDGSGFLQMTPDRTKAWACQTPQVFHVDILRRAYEDPVNADFSGTDDATLVNRIGCPVKLIDGGAMNFKITTKRDLAFATYMLENSLA
jgi:2-C-methyl-D-erythritol 4-phosphate cytidylyltransferase